MEKWKTRAATCLTWIFPIALGIFVFQFLKKLDGPLGVDGYYYLKQFRFFGETHSLYFQDRSLAYVLPFALQLVLKNELLVFRLAVSLVIALTVDAQFFLARFFRPKELNGSLAFAVFAALVLMFDISVYEISVNYYKNAFALMTLTYGLAAFLHYLDSGRKSRLWAAVILFAVSFLSHKSSMLWLGCGMVAFCLAYYERLPRRFLLYLAGGAVISAGAFLLFFQHATGFLAAATQELTWDWRWPSWLFSIHLVRNFIFVAYALQAIFFVLLLRAARRETSPVFRFAQILFCLIFVVTLLPIYKLGAGELGYRLLLATTVWVGPALFLVFRQPVSRFSFAEMAAGALALQFAYCAPMETQFVDYSSVEKEVRELPQYVHDGDYLMVHHGFEFYIDYVTGIRARLFLPDGKVSGEIYHIINLPYAAPKWVQVRHEAYPLKKLQLGREYFLLKQSDWEEVQKKISVPGNWKNEAGVNPGHVYH